MINPTTDQIQAARLGAGLTKKQAASIVFCTSRAWERWESGDRKMHKVFYLYFLIATNQKDLI